ncbi:MAG: DUF1700 domain-containing protein [Oscillospiraceae bacterium]|nr:DUF1700 domain-containing protein [Oscillospiraceae bacterium]
MTTAEFTEALRKGLTGLPREDLEERLAFYSEAVQDRMEEGLSEEEAVAQLGPVEEVLAQIAAETPLVKLVKERVKPKRALRAWEIVLLVLGSPIWVSLLIAAAAILFSLYVTVWAVLISLWAVDLSLAAGALAGLAGGFLFLIKGRLLPACCSLGAALLCAGLAILMFFFCLWLSKALVKGTGKFFVGLKARLMRKEKTE